MTSFLDDNQTQSFHQNGYVIVKNFFNDEETKLLDTLGVPFWNILKVERNLF